MGHPVFADLQNLFQIFVLLGNIYPELAKFVSQELTSASCFTSTELRIGLSSFEFVLFRLDKTSTAKVV